MVTVKFSESVYSVGEGGGQVEVCAILRGQTERDISVTVSTMSGIASGRHARFLLVLMNHHHKLFTFQMKTFIPSPLT